LIFNHGLRDIPYSDDERIMSNSLTELYHNFASQNLSIYSDHELEECKPKLLKYLVINSPKDFIITGVDHHFGNADFWDEIEETLSERGKRTSHDEL
jgi:hypothetical protein